MNQLSRSDVSLIDLEQRYAELSLFEHSNWRDFSDRIDLTKFRGEDAYMSQLNYGMTLGHYQRTFDYLVQRGERGNLVKLDEDESFGAICFQSGVFQNGVVTYSRDLLDSISELRFIRETLSLNTQTNITILDVGAGYGRLLHRISQMFGNAKGYGVDGVPLSTYICDFYLKYRGVYPTMQAVPLDYLGQISNVDLATNVYSFAECTLSTIDYWLKFCADLNIKYFFLCPHDYSLTVGAFVSHETDGRNLDYWPLFERYGYKLLRRVYKYEPKEISPTMVFGTEFCMFERK